MKTVVIIGVGFSGALTAVHLLRHPWRTPLRLILINRSGRMARGIAYGTRSAEHILNVPAGNMSALPDDPEHFLRFCHWTDPAITAASFVSRRLYGTYLEATLTSAEHECTGNVQVDRIESGVRAMQLVDDGRRAELILDSDQRLRADHVVLALGHFAPNHPSLLGTALRDHPRYIRDPWLPGGLDAVKDAESVLLIGSGLTALDVASTLAQRHAAIRIHCVSRRGLLPQPHRRGGAPVRNEHIAEALLTAPPGARSYLRCLRRLVGDAARQGVDWRDVLAALRPITPALWHRLPIKERARFLRHVQPYWDVLRHRCAPDAHAQFHALVAAHRITLAAGRLMSCTASPDALHIAVRRRGQAQTDLLCFDRVVNCTGPASDVAHSEEPLVRHLLAQGLIRRDALGLGLDVDHDYALLAVDGRPSGVLRYTGPLLKARDWEATAVPELRRHAQQLAACLVALDT